MEVGISLVCLVVLTPMQVDNDGNNLLHEASRLYVGISSKEAGFIQQLLGYGISVNDKNNQGLTPLYIKMLMASPLSI
jgi:ankyrin repeat protein